MLRQSARTEERQDMTSETDTLLLPESPTTRPVDPEMQLDATTQQHNRKKRRTNELEDDNDSDDCQRGILSKQEENGARTNNKRHDQEQSTTADKTPSTKKARHMGADIDNKVDTTLASSSSTTVPVSRKDPCVVLPTEVWHQVLSYLPLSSIARV
ncbi:hypothetical protein BGX29_012071 [Mortierella sp. GBA35]|nr:hypothetical protein BGX29_012071 [Mortierella sp. GBA35]